MRLLRRSHHQIEIMQSRSSRSLRFALSRIRPPRDAGSAIPSVVIMLLLGARRETIKFSNLGLILKLKFTSVHGNMILLLPSFLSCAGRVSYRCDLGMRLHIWIGWLGRNRKKRDHGKNFRVV